MRINTQQFGIRPRNELQNTDLEYVFVVIKWGAMPQFADGDIFSLFSG